jgi:hypothetical protein
VRAAPVSTTKLAVATRMPSINAARGREIIPMAECLLMALY